jgi:hypothetical protein
LICPATTIAFPKGSGSLSAGVALPPTSLSAMAATVTPDLKLPARLNKSTEMPGMLLAKVWTYPKQF